MKTLIAYILWFALWVLVTASSAYAQVLATIPVMTDSNHDAHDYSFGPVTIPASASFYRIVFDTKDRLQGAQTMTVVVNLSVVGGPNPQPAGGAVFSSAVQPADFVTPIPQIGADYRVLSGRLTLFGGRWRGAAFIEIE
jgi:hypothetical protein